jgi:DNA helicase-2/ATP-dependent DNA helicase PcrA
MEDGTFPHMRALSEPLELEEERRLAYVGITRARERLYLSRAAVRSAWGAPQYHPASRFLDEIPPELVQWERLESAVDAARQGRRTGGSAMESLANRREMTRASSRPALHLNPGDRVTHDSFGLGTVLRVEGDGDRAMAHVDFGAEGVKRLLLRYAPVTKL